MVDILGDGKKQIQSGFHLIFSANLKSKELSDYDLEQTIPNLVKDMIEIQTAYNMDDLTTCLVRFSVVHCSALLGLRTIAFLS